MRNVPSWRGAVVVSKNAGGTKRVTSLADALKLNFAIVSTDKVRNQQYTDGMGSSMFFDTLEPQAMRTVHAKSGDDGDDGADNGPDMPVSDPATRMDISDRGRAKIGQGV